MPRSVWTGKLERKGETPVYDSDDSVDDLEVERHSATTTVSPFIARLGERWFRVLEEARAAAVVKVVREE